MIKVQEQVSISKQTNCETSKHYTISLSTKRNGYKSRTTLQIIGGGKNPRIYAFSTNSKLDTIKKLLEKLIEYKNANFYGKKKRF